MVRTPLHALIGLLVLFGLFSSPSPYNLSNPVLAQQSELHANAVSTQDTGTWAVMSSPDFPVTYSLNSVAAVSTHDAWAVGYKGVWTNGTSDSPLILHWDGAKWSQVSVTTDYYDYALDSVMMVSPQEGWAVGGAYGSTESYGATLHWDGVIWTKTGGGTIYLHSMDALSASDVRTAGTYRKQTYTPLLTTTYGSGTARWNGSSWDSLVTFLDFGSGLNSIDMVSTSDGWAVGWESGSNLLRHWNGSVWNNVSGPAFENVQDLRSVAMVSTSDGWAVGNEGTILHWNGSVWSQVSSPVSQTLYSVKMVSANEGWIVGDGGTILHWNGLAWSQVSSPITQSLRSVTMLSANEGWAVGQAGAILHYSNYKVLYLPFIVK